MTQQHPEKIALAALEDLKAEDILVLNVQKLTDITDTMIICCGRSNRHVKSIADNLAQTAKDNGFPPLSIEGGQTGDWVLVDLGDVVVHIMLPTIREFYNLEELWDEHPTHRDR